MNPHELVYCDAHGIMSASYYWVKRHELGLEEDTLREAGITEPVAQVHVDVARRLKLAILLLRAHGYTLIVKDGYRSPSAYRLASEAFAASHGETFVAARFNLTDMPHSSGRAIDVALVELETGLEIRLHDDQNGPGAAFVEFYRHRDDPRSVEFQRRQDILHRAMDAAGFILGTKREVWHFELPA